MHYLCSERRRWGRSFGSGWFLIVFNLNSINACLFVRTITNKMTLFPTFETSACLSVFFAFFVVCSLVDNSGSIHGVIISRRETWSRRCTISWSAPVLIVGSRVVASRAMPNPSRSLPLSLSLGMIVKGPIFRMK